MLHNILRPEVQQFILDHEKEDEQKLLLRNKSILDVPTHLIVKQITGRRKAKDKLPLLYNTPDIVYPPGVSLEQSSSEVTAKFKADLMVSFSGKKNSIADLTGGFGIDTFYFSKCFANVSYVEPERELLEVVRHNMHQLGSLNIQYYNATAEIFLQNAYGQFDWIYADPSRRNIHDKKIFLLSDSVPNVISILDTVFQKTGNLMIKTSPLLDIQQGISELKKVTAVYVISVNNECKEVLFICQSKTVNNTEITAVDITRDNTNAFSFFMEDERHANVAFAGPNKFLYEPNASLLKAGAFKSLCEKFNVYKLHTNTHLYTSENLVSNFPGRKFQIEGEVKPDPKNVKFFFPGGKANVTTRNYPLSVDALKKKTGLKDGGEKFLIGFTGPSKKHLVAALKL